MDYSDDLYSAGAWWTLENVIRKVDPEIHTLLVLFHQPAAGALATMLTLDEQRETLGSGFPAGTFATGVTTANWSELEHWQSPAVYRPAC